MTKDERQSLCIDKWKAANGRGILLLCTGFGKTITALKICKRIFTKTEKAIIMVVVPSDNLRTQWVENIAKFGLHNNNIVIYTIQSLLNKPPLKCDLLIADEVHMYASVKYYETLMNVKHKYFLGLTGTLTRLDGREKLLLEHAPVVDEITITEAVEKKWVSDYIQYKVEIDVDLTEYNKHNAEFLNHFSFFDFNFELAMACVKDRRYRIALANKLGQSENMVMVKGLGFMRAMRARKSFIYDHPKKIELAHKILDHRADLKFVTFTKSVKHAKLIDRGMLYHGDIKPKSKKDKILSEFNELESGVLNTCKAVDFGTDLTGVNGGIIISGDSGSITKAQRLGRIIRFAPDKVAELFTFVIKKTTEEQWFTKSNGNRHFVTLSEKQLDLLLKGEDYENVEPEPKSNFMFTL